MNLLPSLTMKRLESLGPMVVPVRFRTVRLTVAAGYRDPSVEGGGRIIR